MVRMVIIKFRCSKQNIVGLALSYMQVFASRQLIYKFPKVFPLCMWSEMSPRPKIGAFISDTTEANRTSVRR